MTRARALVALLVVGLMAGGAYVAWDQVLRGDQVAPLALGTASAGPPASAAPTADGTGGGATSGASADPFEPIAPQAIAGTWTVGGDSVAGYRVRERLANLPAESDAVGRTNAVTGSATLEAAGETIRLTGATITVDLTTLTSDESMRDRRLRTDGLESTRFPTATFTLRAPLDVPAGALAGTTVDLVLAGTLDLHGVTRPVEIPAQARLAGGAIEVVGSLTFAFSDFGMAAPNVGGFILSIADEGTLEFLVQLVRA